MKVDFSDKGNPWNWYYEEGWNKKEYESTISWSSVGFTKPMIDYKILADSQHYLLHFGSKYITFFPI